MLDTYANRVRFVRSLTKLSREAFEEKYGINRNTIKSWELGVNSLTEKSAKVLSDAIIEEGFSCSPHWLIFGQGSEPRPLNDADEAILLAEFDEQSRAIYEADFFKKNNPNSAVCMVTDKSMEPIFKLGDYVGGINMTKDMSAYIGEHSIVSVRDEAVMIRKVLRGRDNTVVLSPVNSNFESDVVKNDDIISIARIVWHRTYVIREDMNAS